MLLVTSSFVFYVYMPHMSLYDGSEGLDKVQIVLPQIKTDSPTKVVRGQISSLAATKFK